MLIAGAEIEGVIRDVRIEGTRIIEIGELHPRDNERVIEARGGALIPGLHDHHIHLFAFAAKQASIQCGPPEVTNIEELATALHLAGTDWLRGIGYHESVAGMLDAATLDQLAPNRPVRIQHRGGRMWFLNSAALDDLLNRAPAPPGMDITTGQLFDDDAWLRQTLGSQMPNLSAVSQTLAAFGVTGVTDMSPSNDPAVARFMAEAQHNGSLLQSVMLASKLSLGLSALPASIALGPAKLHLHEADLPDHNSCIAFIRAAHDQHRPVAIHCVTEVELVFALSALEGAGSQQGDRIEHASVAPDTLLAEIKRMNLCVVAQPQFVQERGDNYLADIPQSDWPALYRLNAFLEAGVTLAGGSDAPFGTPDPWAAMRAAVERTTSTGALFGQHEALVPEQALALYLAEPADLRKQRRIKVGAVADLCLLDRNWAEARSALSPDLVRVTVAQGSIVHDRVDQSPP